MILNCIPLGRIIKYFTIVILIIQVSPLSAQDRCIDDSQRVTFKSYPNHPFLQHPKAALRIMENQEKILIPTIIHVIHNGEAVGEGNNLSAEQIWSQIHATNRDLNRRNPDASNTPNDFIDLASALEMELKMVPYDTNGNLLAEIGIERIESAQSSWSEGEMITSIIPETMWDPQKYLNIWIAPLKNNFIGFAYYPVAPEVDGLHPDDDIPFATDTYDGAVIDSRSFGSADYDDSDAFNLRKQYNLGRTLSHELGHWMGLFHPWGVQLSCNNDDFCIDTPSLSQSHTGIGSPCSYPNDSRGVCESESIFEHTMFQNFMDYTDDICMNLFTHHQKNRARQTLTTSPDRNTINQGAPLVELSIQASRIDTNINLSWTKDVDSEKGSYALYIEKSTSLTDFEPLAILSSQEVSFTDILKESTNPDDVFYRISAVNKEGFSVLSNIINSEGKEIPDVDIGDPPVLGGPEDLEDVFCVFPNPTEGIFNISIDKEIAEYSIEVLSYTGKLITGSDDRKNSEGKVEIDLSSYSKGMYIIRLNYAGGQAYKRILLQ